MTPNHHTFDSEFATVQLLLKSNEETRAVDAYVLSILKSERQLRKLFTHLMFQFPTFTPSNTRAFKQTLVAHRNVYFEGLFSGINALYLRVIVGKGHDGLLKNLTVARKHRNKLFHGQLTGQGLSRKELEDSVAGIQDWCKELAAKSLDEFGYDGFGRTSLQKNKNAIYKTFRVQISSLAEYRDFILEHIALK